MYNFQTGARKRRSKTTIRLLIILICILVIALCGVLFAYFQAKNASSGVQSAILARAISEAGQADAAIKSLTTSSGTNTNSLLSAVRSHVYALQSLNMLAANVYGVGTEVADSRILADCISLLDTAEKRMAAGSVITEQTSAIRNNISLLVEAFSGSI